MKKKQVFKQKYLVKSTIKIITNNFANFLPFQSESVKITMKLTELSHKSCYLHVKILEIICFFMINQLQLTSEIVVVQSDESFFEKKN